MGGSGPTSGGPIGRAAQAGATDEAATARMGNAGGVDEFRARERPQCEAVLSRHRGGLICDGIWVEALRRRNVHLAAVTSSAYERGGNVAPGLLLISRWRVQRCQAAVAAY